jgi:hypothetical protein
VAGDVRCGWCTAPVAEQGATIAEGDEPGEPAADNSLGRLLALSDGVFAIAMTLLALDLRLPDLGTDASDAQLRHALGDDWRGTGTDLQESALYSAMQVAEALAPDSRTLASLKTRLSARGRAGISYDL